MSVSVESEVLVAGRKALDEFLQLAVELEEIIEHRLPSNIGRGTQGHLLSISERLQHAIAGLELELDRLRPDAETIGLLARMGRRAAKLAFQALTTGVLVGVGTGAATVATQAVLAAERTEACAQPSTPEATESEPESSLHRDAIDPYLIAIESETPQEISTGDTEALQKLRDARREADELSGSERAKHIRDVLNDARQVQLEDRELSDFVRNVLQYIHSEDLGGSPAEMRHWSAALAEMGVSDLVLEASGLPIDGRQTALPGFGDQFP